MNSINKCCAVIFETEKDFLDCSDFDLTIVSPDHLHPADLRKFVEKTLTFADAFANMSIGFFTRNPYALDLFSADHVLICVDGKRHLLSDHPKWATCKEMFSSGEFWATLPRNAFSVFSEKEENEEDISCVKEKKQDGTLVEFDKFNSKHISAFRYFTQDSGHPDFKFEGEDTDIHLIGDKIASYVLSRRFPKSKSLPTDETGIEFMWVVTPNVLQSSSVAFYIGLDDCKFESVTIEIPPSGYKLLIDEENRDNPRMVFEITKPELMKLVGYERSC